MTATRLVLASLLLGVSVPSAAQQPVPLGGAFQVNTDTAFVADPVIAADGNGNFVVVWWALGSDGSAAGIFGRRYDSSGSPVGPPFQVNTYTTGDQHEPALAMDASGRFVVTWTSQGQDGSSTGLFAQLFDSSGTPVNGEFRVPIATLYGQGSGRVGMAGDGTFVVVWNGFTQGGAYDGQYGRRFDAVGTALGEEFSVREHPPAWTTMAMNSAGEFVLAWGSEVRARRFDPDGNPLGAEDIPVPTVPTGAVKDPSVGLNDDGRFAVAWNRGLTRNPEIAVRWFEESGTASAQFVVNSYSTGTQSAPALALDPSGAFVVVWQSTGQDGSGEGIFGQGFDSFGNRLGPEFQVNTYTTGHQSAAAVANTPAGGFVVAWADSKLGSNGQTGVFGRRFATLPDLIFEDGFESGDASVWSSAQTDGGDLRVTPGAAMAGTTFGLEAVVDDTAGLFVLDDTPGAEALYRARFYLDPTGYDPGEASGHQRTHVFLAFEDAPFRRLLQVILRRVGGVYGLAARVRQDDESLADTGFTTISAAPHLVEIHWVRATAAGANDGSFEMWIDGTPAGALAGLDNDERSIDFVRLGAMSVKSGASGTIAFDEFVSRRFTDIGP